ncbi:hypothetical protein OE88DRAFT_1647035 [Heliocybe sulcata]|uniref:Uncharacterized protein n=1 Tax=Heliocybe sulcata TaxID=5364 RepID=A0A5C3MWA6_9AGAM|nr:hypothetical protein OE88DRAFT_1647035 [Heliocybe sulcata]
MDTVTAVVFQTLFKAALGGTVEDLSKFTDFVEKRELNESQFDLLPEVLLFHFANQATPPKFEEDLVVMQCAGRIIEKYSSMVCFGFDPLPGLLRLWSDSAWPFMLEAIKPAMVDPSSRSISDDLRNNMFRAFTRCLFYFSCGNTTFVFNTKDVVRYLITIWLEEMRWLEYQKMEAGCNATLLLHNFLEAALHSNKLEVCDTILGPAALFASEIAREVTQYLGGCAPDYYHFVSVFCNLSLMARLWQHSQILHNAFLAENLSFAATNALCILGATVAENDNGPFKAQDVIERALRMLYSTISQSATEGFLVQALQAGLFEGLVNGHICWLPLIREDRREVYYRFFEDVFFKSAEIPSVVYALWQRRTFRKMAMNDEGAPGWNRDLRMQQAWMSLEDRAKSSLQRHADILPDSFEPLHTTAQQNGKHSENCACNLCLHAALAGTIQAPVEMPLTPLSCA